MEFVSFWKWFVSGSGNAPGWKKIFDKWLILHVIVGLLLAFLIPLKLSKAANTVLLPLVGILIGLAFSWAGNAQALLQSKEISEMSDHHEGGYADFVYGYQLAILIILSTTVLWGLAGLNIFDQFINLTDNCYLSLGLKFIYFSLSSLTIRECWHVVLGAQWMLLIQKEIKDKT